MDNDLFGIDVSKKAIDVVEDEILTVNYKKRVSKKDILSSQHQNDDLSDEFESKITAIPSIKSVSKSDRNDIDFSCDDTSLDVNKEF